jgi:hypothetical protein
MYDIYVDHIFFRGRWYSLVCKFRVQIDDQLTGRNLIAFKINIILLYERFEIQSNSIRGRTMTTIFEIIKYINHLNLNIDFENNKQCSKITNALSRVDNE